MCEWNPFRLSPIPVDPGREVACSAGSRPSLADEKLRSVGGGAVSKVLST